MKEIRLHGIGGLGTVKAGEMLVHAAVASGKYGNSIPFSASSARRAGHVLCAPGR